MAGFANEQVPDGEPISGKTYRADGWVYRDLPNLGLAQFDELVGIIGDDNLVWLTLAERVWPDGQKTKRGQVLISPAGIENLRKRKESCDAR